MKFAAESARQTVADEEKRLQELLEGAGGIENAISEYELKIKENDRILEKNSAESESLKNKLSGLERLYRSRKEDFDGAKENFEKIFTN